MNHNKYNLEIGEWVLLDDRMPLVKIFSFTPGKLYVEVGEHEAPMDTWHTMTNRLKPDPTKNLK